MSCCLDANLSPPSQVPEVSWSLNTHYYDDLHQEANQKPQQKQAKFYDRKAGNDKRVLNNMEPVFIRNT